MFKAHGALLVSNNVQISMLKAPGYIDESLFVHQSKVKAIENSNLNQAIPKTNSAS